LNIQDTFLFRLQSIELERFNSDLILIKINLRKFIEKDFSKFKKLKKFCKEEDISTLNLKMATQMFEEGQFANPCADLILELNECYEARGLVNNLKYCKDLQDDLWECKYWGKRLRAVQEINRIRSKKMLTGKLGAQEAFQDPAPGNSFVYYPYHS